MYTGIDLVVEVVVFALTIIALRRFFPELNAWRILRGLLRIHWVQMSMLMFAAWMGNLMFLSTYTGMDPLFRFNWLKCEGKTNSTWIGGFDWECAS